MDETLAEDVLALWQSELTALAADRELREGLVALVALWAAAATALAREHPARGAAPAQPPRAATAAAASGAGDDEVGRLHRRLAELERRLERFERGRD